MEMHSLNSAQTAIKPVLQMDAISKSFRGHKDRVAALRDVSLALGPQETLAIVGESGSGKTTLARVVVGLLQPETGNVKILGRDLSALRRREFRRLRRNVQMVFQDPYSSLDPRQKIGSLIEEPLIVHKVGGRAERREKVDQILEKVGLDPAIRDRYPHQFSGGQRQRIAIARALVLKPKLLVCDEPVSALDVSVQAQVLNLLDELRDELQISMLFISHDLSVVAHIADRVSVMFRGEIVETGLVADVFLRARHPYTQRLLDSVPKLVVEDGCCDELARTGAEVLINC